MFEKVLSPMQIGTMTIKNRFATSAMESCYCDSEGKVTDRYIAYVEARAKGGWGLITNEMNAVALGGRGYLNCSGIWSDDQIPGQRALTDRIHKYEGTKICLQLAHAGKQSFKKLTGEDLLAPSAFADNSGTDIPLEMSIDDIRQMEVCFADAAERAKKAGFDAVEIHGAHGYLIHEFLSPFSNKRCDEYGGSLRGRARFAVEIVKAVKERCGSDYPVIFRLSMSDFHEQNGLYVEDMKAVCLMLEEAGADAFSCSCGAYASKGIFPTVPNTFPHGYNLDMTEEIRKTVTKPVFANGRISDPYLAEAVIRSGKADAIAMGRQSLADPELPNKVMAGETDEIIPCISCNQGCLGQLMSGSKPIKCLMNPALGREAEFSFEKAREKKKIAVIGGGLAGLGAAYSAARRGHSVTVFEKNSELGGQWLAACVPPGKHEGGALLSGLIKQLKKYDVKLKLGCELSKEASNDYDALIIATGSVPLRPEIEGLDEADVISAEDILRFRRPAGRNVVIIGGGQAGAETAHFLSSIKKKVCLVEMKKAIAMDAAPGTAPALKEELLNGGVKIMTNTAVKQVGKDFVIVEASDGEKRLEADTIVLAAGVKSNSLEAFYSGSTAKLVLVGDAKKCANALAAFADGFETAYSLFE